MISTAQWAGREGHVITRDSITFLGNDCDKGEGLYFLFDIKIFDFCYRVRAGILYTRDVGDITGQKMIHVPHDLAASMFSDNRVVIDFADIPYADFPSMGGGRVEKTLGFPVLAHPSWSNDPCEFVPARRGDLALLLTEVLHLNMDADQFARHAVAGYEMIYRAFGKPVPKNVLSGSRMESTGGTGAAPFVAG